MDLELKDNFKKLYLKCKPCVVCKEDYEEIDRQMKENSVAKLAEEYTCVDYPMHCSPAFTVAKKVSVEEEKAAHLTKKRMVVGYGKMNNIPKLHAG